MKKLFFAVSFFVALPSLADSTNIGVDSSSAAFAGAQANPTINNVVGGATGGGDGKFHPTLFMPNAAASTLPNVNQFVKSGPGPAEKSANVSRFLAKSCGFSGGVKPKIIDGDNATMLWLPYPDYALVQNTGGSVFEPLVTDMAHEFAVRDARVTHYCLGQVTIKPIKDDENADLYDPLVLANEALRVLKEEGVLHGNITPVVLYDQAGYIETTKAEGSGLSITPQITGGPAAVSLVAGSMFSWQKNGGWVSPNYRLVLKVVLLAEAPNESLGHPIIENVQNDIRLYAEANKPSQGSEAENGTKQGIQSAGSRR